MKAHLKYASYVARHKWFVFVAGLRVGAPLWRLLIHDWSKLTPAKPATHRALRFTSKLQRQRTRSRVAEKALADEIREKRESYRRLLETPNTPLEGR